MTAPTPPNYSEWKYQATIRITNPVATANYQHLLTLPWKPGMRSDFRDIRFTQQNGINCPYWIETYTARSSATVWIKVPSASQSLIFCYFGNGGAVSNSNGAATFDLFDDFLGSALDTGKWTSTLGAGLAISGSIATMTWASASQKGIYANTTFGVNYAFRALMKAANHTYPEMGWDQRINGGATKIAQVSGDAAGHWQVFSYNTGSAASNIVAFDTSYHTMECQRNGSTSVIGYVDAGTATVTTQIQTDASAPMFSVWQNVIYVDWCLIRKFQATEPTLAYVRAGINIWYVGRRVKDLTVTPYGGTEYVWDPVNVDHERTPGVEAFLYEQSFPTANINHIHTPGVGVTEIEMGPVNVYHARYPVASWDRVITNPVDDTGTLISVNVSLGMDDAMTQAVFDYDGTVVGGIFGNDYMTKIQVQIPDYNGVNRAVFVGIAPSSRAHYEPAKDKMTLTAVDYGLYLTKNQLEDKDLALLPPANQAAEGSNIAKVLSYDWVLHAFQVGQRIVGGVSGATGTIIEVYSGMFLRMTLYPAQGKFVDNEPLMMGGVQYAQADGRSADIPYTPLFLPIYPEDWIRSVLGGDNWMRVTGIEPYQIASSGAYWDTDLCPAVPFMFGSKESIFDAMMRLAKYMKYIMHIKPRNIGGGNYRPAFYWVPLSRIDEYDGLDLPAAAAITGPNNPFLAAPFELEQNGENQVDRVKLMCQDLHGNWLVSAKGTAYANAGEGPCRTFYDEPQDIATQTDLDALCSDLYDLLTPRGMVWHCTFLERSDLEIYQLLTISGYGDKIPNGTYRIIRISHERACAKNLTHVTFMLATAFSTLRKYGMTYMDSIGEIQRIIKHWNDQKIQIELGTCTVTDGTTVTYETEAASKGRGRDGTAVGSTRGTIITGAKIIIHSTRGGVVCLPLIGVSAAGTGLSTVDVPTIISALRDESDHNYWYLIWTPGANNARVSVNVQTVTYPTAPGAVTGPGTTYNLFSRNIYQLRIRFSGPSATYYVKLWGERNGAYSVTGATTTIASGSDVTVGEPEEPEPFGVVEVFLAGGRFGESPQPQQNTTTTIFDGNLPVEYDGVHNLYIGGPEFDNTIPHSYYWGGAWWWDPQPTPRYLLVDNILRITGPKGYIETSLIASWIPPLWINNILNIGVNHVTITLWDNGGLYAVSDLYLRSYYL